jgi:putative transposase
MPRKLRLEFPGACYHVINRGNYRADIFRTEGARLAFEECVFAACDRSAWRLHAYVLMSNHYHLAIETPEANLVAGMQWLQATFANRFNKLRNERGHLFQGRYKALLVEEGSPLAQVAHYIHLNPVRAGLRPVALLAGYRYSSYWYGSRRKERPDCLDLTNCLAEAGGLADTPTGWKAYEDYLGWQAETGPAGKSKAYVNMSRGWALGTAGFKAGLVKDHALAAATRAWESVGAQEIREHRWKAALTEILQRAGKTLDDVRTAAKSASWKAIVAEEMKRTTQASNRWLAMQLQMGRPEAVSAYVGRLRAARNNEIDK